MKLRRTIVRGAVAFAFLVPAAFVAALEGPSLLAFAAAPSFPVACNLSATVTFNPPLTPTGVQSGNSAAKETTTITGGTLSNCLSSDPAGAPTGGTVPTLTITTPATKLIGVKVNKVQQYATGYCPGFASSTTLKALKGLAITVNWTGGAGGSSTFTVHSPGAAVNQAGEVGFAFLGKQGTGSYSERALNQVTAFIDPTDSNALGSGCSGNQTVATATIDGTTSTAIL